ncbi:hypothetical protein ACJJTC_006117 [Scirpophaga incertulas]
MFIEKLKSQGLGKRNLDDVLFAGDSPPPRLGVYDLDDENLCHEAIKTTCNVPGCKFTAETLLEFENHYNGTHRYSCSECKKVLPSPHLLDLHIQEFHDSFFAVMAEKKPSYCCYIEECKEKFLNTQERLEHCMQVHKLPKDFRFEQTHRKGKKHKGNKNLNMEIDREASPFFFNNSKQRGFSKHNEYTGRKFTQSNNKCKTSTADVNMDIVVRDLRSNLPE